MDTDYVSYAVVYGCGSDSVPNLWIMSRTPVMEPALLESLNKQALARLPNYDPSIARRNTQGDPTCTGTYADKWSNNSTFPESLKF